MKYFAFSLVLILSLFLLCACSQPLDLTGEDAAQQILSISKNPEQYLGEEIIFAGYYTYQDFIGRYHYVLLSLSNEENLGFEIRLDGEYPPAGSAVRVRGILKSVNEFGQDYIYLEVHELSVLQPAE